MLSLVFDVTAPHITFSANYAFMKNARRKKKKKERKEKKKKKKSLFYPTDIKKQCVVFDAM